MKKFAFAAAALLCATLAQAADGAFYVGGDLGRAKFSAEGESLKKNGFGAFAGYQLNSNVAFEATVRRLGKVSEDGTSVSFNALQLSALGILPVAGGFTVYGRLGLGRNSLDVTDSGVNASVNKTKALLGAGLGYQFDKQLGLRLEYTHLGNIEFAPGAKIKAQQVNLGLSYQF
jgi:OOP family OmpA-OmpF porin